MNKTPNNNLSDDITVTYGMDKTSTKANKNTKTYSSLDIFDFPDSDDELSQFEKKITRKKSISSVSTSDSPKKTSKNLIDSYRIIGQNSSSNANVSSRNNSSSTRISRFLTSKSASTNNRHSDSRKNGSSGDRISVDVDDVFDFVKFIRGGAKTRRNTRSQPKNGIHESITSIVNDRTNNILSNNVVQPVTPIKKSSKSTTVMKESLVNKPLKKPRKNHILLDIPQTPTRPITEVGTTVSFLSFQQRKKPNEQSVWDVVDAVTSPKDIISSPRKQNLVANMSKPTPTKQDKSQSLSFLKSSSTAKPSKSKMFDTKTKDDEILSYADEFLASSESVFDFPNSVLPSHNMPSGSTLGSQKTYGQGRTILGQDLDSLFLDPLIPSQTNIDMDLNDYDINDDNTVCKFIIFNLFYIRIVIDI